MRSRLIPFLFVTLALAGLGLAQPADQGFEQLRDGQPVIFDGTRGDKGPRAENVRLA